MTKQEQALDSLSAILAGCIEQGKEDGPEMRICMLQELPKTRETPCPIEAVLVVQEGCHHCDIARETFKNLPVRELDANLADKIEPVTHTPQLWLLDCEGKKLADIEI